MSSIPKELKYTETHEWVKIDGEEVVVGITEHAQAQLGDLVYVDLPEVGDEFSAGDDVCVVESVKAASDLYAPLDGEIVEVNESLVDDPSQINTAPYKEGWLFKLKISDNSQIEKLLSAEQYAETID